MSFIPAVEELGIGGKTVDELKETKVDVAPLGGLDTEVVEGLDIELLEDGEGLFGPTAGQVRLKSGVVLSWELTMPKLGIGVIG